MIAPLVDYAQQLLGLLRSLADEQVEYVLIGGGALNIHGFVRATEDVDLFVAPNEENIARLRAALRRVWQDPGIDQITAADLCGDYPAVRYGPPDGSLYVDILTRLGEAFAYADVAWQEVLISGVRVRVATPATLYRMKKNTVRPIDRADADLLRRTFDLKDDER